MHIMNINLPLSYAILLPKEIRPADYSHPSHYDSHKSTFYLLTKQRGGKPPALKNNTSTHNWIITSHRWIYILLLVNHKLRHFLLCYYGQGQIGGGPISKFRTAHSNCLFFISQVVTRGRRTSEKGSWPPGSIIRHGMTPTSHPAYKQRLGSCSGFRNVVFYFFL